MKKTLLSSGELRAIMESRGINKYQVSIHTESSVRSVERWMTEGVPANKLRLLKFALNALDEKSKG